MSLEKLWALEILGQEDQTLELAVTNEKGIQKSIENNELWLLDPMTHRLLPWKEGVPMVRIAKHSGGYKAWVKLDSSGQSQVEDATSQELDLQGLNVLDQLAKVIHQRNLDRPEGSYTTHLFSKGEEKIRKKTGEEAIEMLLAKTDDELIYESADFLFHLFVLLEEKKLDYRDILAELAKRMK